mmetsp:Transcript_34488/g.88484  ORF Transcript_34488/g.88484 Transcript_34488/m.88484 type:complete len:227 (+) Transcript_34488:951-1631(+)
MVMMSPAWILSFWMVSIIFCPRSYIVSISVVFKVILPKVAACPLAGFSISISTTSPSMISASSRMRTPMERLKACVRASVLLISREKISEPASIVKGVSSPKALAMPMAMAVLPVPGWPAMSTARPAIFSSWIIARMTPAARLAAFWPTMPCETMRASSASSRPRPRMCECAPMRSSRWTSRTSAIFAGSAAIAWVGLPWEIVDGRQIPRACERPRPQRRLRRPCA